MGRVFAVANQKGGVGKSTTAVNLSAALALLGWKILLVDIDPQAHATSGAGVRRESIGASIYDLLINGADIDAALLHSPVTNLDLIPSTIDLAGAEVELVDLPERESRLRRVLGPVRGRYDLIVIDCPPSLGLLTIDGMVAADELLIPIQCEYYALEGLTRLMDTVALVRRHLNPQLEVGGVVLTMYDSRTNLSVQVADEVRRHFGGRVYRTVIPRSVRLAEAPSHGQPAVLYDPGSKGSEAYYQLAREVAARVGQQPVAAERSG